MNRIVTLLIAAVVVLGVGIGGRLMFDAPTSKTSTVTLGGPFTLVDHTGKTVTDKDFQGKYMMVYFGYTFCPDVCPTSLGTIAAALDIIGPEKAAKVTPVFITIDPERDTTEVLADYVPNFHPTIVGLGGTVEQVTAVAGSYRAYFAKVNAEEDPENYSVDHSSVVYLMGPDGQFVVHFSHGTTAEDMSAKLADIL